jgi:preprotein translocase subunit Sss1
MASKDCTKKKVREAWEAYRDFYGRTCRCPTDDEYTKIWDGVGAYIRTIIKTHTYVNCNFDMDDLMADAQLTLWQRICQRNLPVQDPVTFIGAVNVMTRQMLIDTHRHNGAEQRTRTSYADRVELVTQPCFVTQMWAAEMLKKHQVLIARMMAKRSRFKEVTIKLSTDFVILLQKNAKLSDILDVIRRTGYWDPKFLLEHMQVLYRWSYYDLREQMLDLVA